MNRYITLSFFLLFFLGNALYPQQKTLSNNLYTTLSESGIETEIQLLSNSQSESFPFSIIYSSQTTNKYPLHKLCVIIPQNTAFLIKNELIDFIKKLEKDKTPYYVDIILTADDYSPIPEEILPTIPAGTATFIDNLDTNEYTDKAGAYGIQGYAARFVEKICGCYFNVVGLPLSLLDNILSEKGII